MMHGPEKSDLAIVAMKPANNAAQAAAEWVEPRGGGLSPRRRRRKALPGWRRIRRDTSA